MLRPPPWLIKMLIVTKIGGNVIKRGFSHLITDIKNNLLQNQIVLVHGGGGEVTEIASKMGKEQRFVISPRGFRSRYTDKETVEIYSMVMIGKINKQIVSALQSQGVPSVGLSGIDGTLVRAERKKRIIIVDERGRKRVIDGGYTGRISQVDPRILQILLENGYLPVIAPVACGDGFELLNVDGDRMAAHIAGALKAVRLIFLTDVPGITLEGKLLTKIKASELKKLLPKIGHGMITKAYAAIEALNLGVSEVIISSGLEEKPLSSPLAYECGTVISIG